MDAARVAAAQGAYYVVAGAWPLVSMRTFEAITGPKRERWLVKTVGALALTIGVNLLMGSKRQRQGAGAAHARLLAGLGTQAALAFAAVDIWYAAKRRISPIYLGDAALELALVAAWRRVGRQRGRDWAPVQPALPSGRGVVSGTQAIAR